MDIIKDFLGLLGNPGLRDAMIVVILLVIIVRMALPVIFAFRTKIQQALEETYKVHVDELKCIIEEKKQSEDELKQQVEHMTTEFGDMKRHIVVLVAYLRTFGCNKAPSCETHEQVDYDFCDGCIKEASCDGCPFSGMITE